MNYYYSYCYFIIIIIIIIIIVIIITITNNTNSNTNTINFILLFFYQFFIINLFHMSLNLFLWRHFKISSLPLFNIWFG